MRYLRALIVLVALVAFPATAFAYKPATQSQKKALMGAAGDSRVPARCVTAFVSTANRSWAEIFDTGLWQPGPKRVPHGCEKFDANGVSILHYRAGHWHGVTSGSDFATSTGGCHVPHVPKAVVSDFRLCGSLKPQTAASPKMTAPSRASIGARITVHADGLRAGRYTLLLAAQLSSGGASPTDCSARVGSAAAQAGKVTISGKLPRRLACRAAQGPLEGYVSVHPGKYVLSLGILIPPAGFRAGSFAKRTIHLVK